jgi:hypothetical protein
LSPSLNLEEWGDPLWRLSNIYRQIDDDGRDFAFVPNEEQLDFYDKIWYRNNILKARQLGFTTWVDLIALDQTLFNNNYTSVIVAHTLDDSGKIFRNKVQYAYEKLPPGILERIPLKTKTQSKELYFKNGSSISVTTSARGGTTQFLHISEFGKIARRFPEKAEEIVTGSFESVPVDGTIVVESTAEGNAGRYYDLSMEALEMMRKKTRLTKLDFKLHFYPWYLKQANRLDEPDVKISEEHTKYFEKCQRMLGIKLDHQQRVWYVKKLGTNKKAMTREHPTTPEEAFAQSVDGAIYSEEMSWLREKGRIGQVGIRPGLPVNTFWDLGSSKGNATSIWLHQRFGANDRFVKYFGETGKGMRYFWEKLVEFQGEHKFKWGIHHLPHDAAANMQGAELVNRIEILEALGQETRDGRKGYEPGEVLGVKRTHDLALAIDAVKNRMPDVMIDEEGCVEGIRGLDNYQYEWIAETGTWSRNPLHNWASNPCDAFRQWAQAYHPEGPDLDPPQTAMQHTAVRGAY